MFVREYGLLEASKVVAFNCDVGFHLDDNHVLNKLHDCTGCGCDKVVVWQEQEYAFGIGDEAFWEDAPDACDQTVNRGQPEPGQERPFRRYKRRSTAKSPASGCGVSASSGKQWYLNSAGFVCAHTTPCE